MTVLFFRPKSVDKKRLQFPENRIRISKKIDIYRLCRVKENAWPLDDWIIKSEIEKQWKEIPGREGIN